MTQLMRAISATCFAVLLAFGFAGVANAADGGVSKASYSASDNSMFQLVKLKPCCYNPYNRAYARSTPSTCNKYGGYIVQDGYCGGYGYQGYPGHPGYPNQPGWNGGGYQGYGPTVCCKRKRRDWWARNAYTCQQQGGYVVHGRFCRND
jgi:hypothetical protein